ncbi:50S ribosomal protein L11 methyltransferase [Saccharolobus shibatae]|uniref:Putative SAM-dependent methyltransferase n=1 Tax=Saccharolobus shibatae TaxID=2286 RepID=A0A8F5GZS8_9CREN|nr:50S ribosomal protein L11 methyltransferase [Saccharolobus shibatae]QXJ34877.1 putative SAM-dependent methyltransferase [Saccharolobus shibatae]
MEFIPLKRMLELIKLYSTTFKNWYSVMLDIYLHREKIKCTLRNGQTLYLTPNEAVLLAGLRIIELDRDTVKFSFNDREITLRGWRLSYPGDSFSDYWRINVKGKRVLDIGAGIGDSPIYFSLMGAKEVVAVEIDKKKVELMKENLRTNGINNVIVVDKGVDTVDSENLISWERLIKDYGPFDAAKIDCDGCEGVISPFIKEIPELLIEWDNDYKDIVKNLSKNGYKVRVEHTLKNLGFIYAKRE